MLGSTIIIFGYFSSASSLSMVMDRRGQALGQVSHLGQEGMRGIRSSVYLKLWISDSLT